MSEVKKKAIVVTDSCPICKQVKEIIAERGLQDKVTLINASTPEGKQFAIDNGITGVPECVIIDENGKQKSTCSREEFEKLLMDGT